MRIPADLTVMLFIPLRCQRFEQPAFRIGSLVLTFSASLFQLLSSQSLEFEANQNGNYFGILGLYIGIMEIQMETTIYILGSYLSSRFALLMSCAPGWVEEDGFLNQPAMVRRPLEFKQLIYDTTQGVIQQRPIQSVHTPR